MSHSIISCAPSEFEKFRVHPSGAINDQLLVENEFLDGGELLALSLGVEVEAK